MHRGAGFTHGAMAVYAIGNTQFLRDSLARSRAIFRYDSDGTFSCHLPATRQPARPHSPQGCIVDIQTLIMAAGMLLLAPLGFLILMVWFTFISPFLFGSHYSSR
jgi:hypothetical protein